jgi:Bifunctional DNA primase/polymerase, N-terminal
MLWRRSKFSLADAALAYAELGIPVFPSHWPAVGSTRRLGTPGCSCQLVACSYPGEHPLVPDWLGTATTDPARIEAWWCQHPRANVGLLTGVVFDVLDVPAELVEDQAVLATLPDGPVARTGTGRHHFFVAPSGRGNVVMPARSGNARQRVYWHGRSGYVLAAPSRHVGGGATQWLRPLDTPVPDAPPRAFTAMAGAWVQPA